MKNKFYILIICICIFMSLSIIFSAKCFASSDIDYSYYNDLIKSLDNRPYFLSRSGSGNFAMFAYPCCNHYNHWNFKNDDIYFYVKNNILVCRNGTRNEETSHFSDYACDDGKNVRTIHSCWNGNNSFAIDDMNKGHEMYTNKPVYKDIDKKEVFFLRPQTTLGQVLEKAKVIKTFQTMTRGMIKYLILFVIGLVAFWKSWHFLSNSLHKA